MSTKRVLIVEDDAHIADLLRMHLGDEGYEVAHAASGDAGLRLLEQDGPWDALVLDVMLPGVDGLQVCQRARAMARYVPIIIISARGSETQRIVGLELGADDYLAKPFSMPELVARVRALLRRAEAMAQSARIDAGAIELGGLQLDPVARTASVDGNTLELTPARIRPAAVLRPSPGPGVRAHGAPQPGLGLPARRLRAHGQHPYQSPAQQDRARPGQPAAVADGVGPWLQAGRPGRGGRMIKPNLWQKLAVVTAALMLACCMALLALQMRANTRHEQEVVQRLSLGLAEHIAQRSELMDTSGMRDAAVRALFGQLMAVNPSVEVYLLDDQGRILGHDAPSGHLVRTRVDVAPLRRLLAGAPLPILGDDPRSADGRKVFSAAPLIVQGRQAGYVYVVLVGEHRQMLADDLAAGSQWNTTLWSVALVGGLGLLAGLVAFYWVTRPLRRLTRRIQAFDIDAPTPLPPAEPLRPGERDELVILEHAHAQMAQRLGEQWQQLRQQDLQRRELVANISHDLRTPLSSLHGYLETLALKDATLSPDERRRYLGIALAQSAKVGRLARALFELARLEHGEVRLEWEVFALPELLQDVLQKFELAAQARGQQLHAAFPPGLPPVRADLGLVERVLTNLLDNALRHAPEGGQIEVRLRATDDSVEVSVADDGPGVAPALRTQLFQAPAALGARRGENGGLGLLIVQRIVQLHGRHIELRDSARGALFVFALPRAEPAA